MRATAYDFVVVPLMGVPLNNIAALTFALGAGLAAAAGILFSVAYPVLDPIWVSPLAGRHLWLQSWRSRFYPGAAVAGFMLGFIEIFVAAFFPSTLRDLIAYSIILVSWSSDRMDYSARHIPPN